MNYFIFTWREPKIASSDLSGLGRSYRPEVSLATSYYIHFYRKWPQTLSLRSSPKTGSRSWGSHKPEVRSEISWKSHSYDSQCSTGLIKVTARSSGNCFFIPSVRSTSSGSSSWSVNLSGFILLCDFWLFRNNLKFWSTFCLLIS